MKHAILIILSALSALAQTFQVQVCTPLASPTYVICQPASLGPTIKPSVINGVFTLDAVIPPAPPPPPAVVLPTWRERSYIHTGPTAIVDFKMEATMAEQSLLMFAGGRLCIRDVQYTYDPATRTVTTAVALKAGDLISFRYQVQ